MTTLLLGAWLCAGLAGAMRSPEILLEVLKFAREELERQHVGEGEEIVFEERIAPGWLPFAPGTEREMWPDEYLRIVMDSTGMKPGTLDSVRRCTTLRSGRLSCTLRPTRAVVAVSRPDLSDGGTRATVHVAFTFQPRTLRYHPETGEPFEIHYSQGIRVELTRKDERWAVAGVTRGPPGVSVDH